MSRKSIGAEKIDDAFAEVLRALEPTKGMVDVVKAMLNNAWSQRKAQAKARKDEINRDIAKLNKQLDGLLDRIVESNNPTVIAAYEKKVTKLEHSKLMLIDKMDQDAKPKHTLAGIFELTLAFLSNPWNI